MGFWLKWEKGLTRKPEVLQMAARLLIPPTQAAGSLMLVMEWLDDNVGEYTHEGHANVTLKSLNASFLDHIAGVSGFSEALAEVDWLRTDEGVLQFLNAGKHNGMPAKKRAEAALRQRRSRAERPTPPSVPQVPRPVRRMVLERDRYCCVYCGTKSSYQREFSESSKRGVLCIDHVNPRSKGGSSKPGNLVCSCLPCNRVKYDRTMEEVGYELAHLQPELKIVGGEITIVSQERVTELGRFSSDLLSDSSDRDRITTVIPLLLSTDAFADAWRAWLQHRREIKKPIAPGSETEKQQLKTLETWGEAKAIAAIRYTIFKGWQGLREPDPNDKEYANHPAGNSRSFSQSGSYAGVTDK